MANQNIYTDELLQIEICGHTEALAHLLAKVTIVKIILPVSHSKSKKYTAKFNVQYHIETTKIAISLVYLLSGTVFIWKHIEIGKDLKIHVATITKTIIKASDLKFLAEGLLPAVQELGIVTLKSNIINSVTFLYKKM